MELALVNPRKRKGRKASRRKSRRVARRKRVAASHSRRLRNPSVRGIVNQIQPAVKAGLIGAAGGLGLSVGLGYLQEKLPAQLQSGYALTAVKILGAIGVGILGNMLLKGKGSALTTGAMTVVAYDEAKKLIAAQFPGVPLGEYINFAPVVGYDSPLGIEGMGEYMQDGMGLSGTGEYVSDSEDQGGGLY